MTSNSDWRERDPAANLLLRGCVWVFLYAVAITISLAGLFVAVRILS